MFSHENFSGLLTVLEMNKYIMLCISSLLIGTSKITAIQFTNT